MAGWETKVRGRLQEIRSWQQEGESTQEIAKKLGITPKALARMANAHVSLQDALGHCAAVDAQVEEALMRIAVGYTVTDRTYELRDTEDGGKRLRMTKKVVKQQEPQMAAVRMWLQSRAPQRWQPGNTEAQDDATAEPALVLQEAKRLIAELEQTSPAAADEAAHE